MGLQKNVASQKWRVFAFDTTDGTAKTGDAANITAKIAKDWAAAAATNDVNPTETEDGYYNFDLTQAETNADALDLFPESSTANIQVIGVPGSQGTRVVQTGDSFGRLGAPAGASVSADVADVPTVAEFDARTLVAASYFDPTADDVATVTTLTNKTGFALSTAGILAIWHQALTAIVTAGSVGKLLKDEITAVRMATLTDWINGGRLDLLLDAIKAVTDNLPDSGSLNDLATILTDTSELQTVLSAAILARTNNANLNALLGVADTAGEDVPGQTAFEVADEVLTGGTHNVVNSLGRRIRDLQEFGVYDVGAIWIDTINGTAGTTDFESGTAFNPVDSIADANTLAASLGLGRFVVGSGSTITFAAAQANQTFFGENWTLAFGGQNIGGSHIRGAEVSGISTGAPSFDHCHLNVCTFAGGEFTDCGLQDTITLSGAVAYTFINCYHAEAGAPSTIDFGAAVGATEVHIHNWHGNLTVLNMKVGDILHFSCSNGTLTLDATCTAGTVNLAGTFGLTDNSSGMTKNDNGQMYQRVGAPVGADISADIAAIPTTAMRGTDNAALASVATEGRLAELDAANLPADVDTIKAAATEARLAELDAANLPQTTDNILTDTAVIGALGAGLTDLGGMSTGMKAEVNAECDTALSDMGFSTPQKNVALSDISVFMVDSTDHVTPKTGLSLTVTRSLDGAAFGSGTGTAAEIANGMYQYDASQADMNADVIIFRFAGTAADDTFITIHTRA